MRPALAVLCLFLLAPAAGAEETSKPMGLKGAPGVITPPSGAWTQTNDSLAPGQWYVQYTAKGDAALLRAHVFPVKHATDPEKVLVQALDVFFRAHRASFGMPSAHAVDVWGCPGAEASIMAVLGERVSGRARIVRLNKHQWGFAIGYARDDAGREMRTAVTKFVASLEPAAPVFHERRFHDPARLDRVAVRVPGDEPLTSRHVAAVARVLEEGVGERFPLALKPPIRAALVADALKGTSRTRAGYRATAEALDASRSFEPAKRDANLRALGRKILEAILERANGGYEPAVQFARAWHEFRSIRAGDAEDYLTAGALANRMEMSEFLASIAADRELRIQGPPRHELVKRVHARWKDIPASDRDGWRKVGALWASLRYAWDQATPETRFAFRRALLTRLSLPDQRTAIEALGDERALKRWMMSRAQTGLDTRLLDAAFELSLADRRALIGTLGVADAYGFHFGW